jgi:hypothetical protein
METGYVAYEYPVFQHDDGPCPDRSYLSTITEQGPAVNLKDRVTVTKAVELHQFARQFSPATDHLASMKARVCYIGIHLTRRQHANIFV